MLTVLGAQSALPCLKSFMFALSRGCTRMIEVQCVCQKRISPDERALLDALLLTQAMRPFEALLLLRGFEPRRAPTQRSAARRAWGRRWPRQGAFCQNLTRRYATSDYPADSGLHVRWRLRCTE